MRRLLIGIAVLGTVHCTSPIVRPTADHACQMSRVDQYAVQDALNAWEHIEAADLRLAPSDLPWTVLFDDSCAWHLAPDDAEIDAPVALAMFEYRDRPVDVRVAAHSGVFLLPGHQQYKSRPIGTIVGLGERPVVLAAIGSYWAAAEPGLVFGGVLIHEYVHARQYAALLAQLRALGRRYRSAPSMDALLDDDIIENRFRENPAFAESIAAELDLLHRAATEPDTADKRALLRRALDRIDRRRGQFYGGRDAMLGRLETLYLNFEGVAEWAAYRFHRMSRSSEETLDLARSGDTPWSQRQGLALFLLIDQLIPGWQAQVFSPALPGPTSLLRSALRDGTPR